MNFQPISMKETEATSLLSTQDDQGVAALVFKNVTDYTTFRVEHAFDGDDIVFHFFRTPECPEKDYWEVVFPNVLSEVAQEIFQAGYPRLRAAFTHEQDSWWMRAGGFANAGIPEERCARFYAALDKALEARNIKNRPA